MRLFDENPEQINTIVPAFRQQRWDLGVVQRWTG